MPEPVFKPRGGTKKVTLKNILSHTGGLTVHGFRGYKSSENKPDLKQILNGVEPANSSVPVNP